ncbi:MAG TPA: galactoside ABC transporter permease [Firmicutes bacterium]|nr:galactoside ABC transporter permease [Bacillota bacterium]
MENTMDTLSEKELLIKIKENQDEIDKLRLNGVEKIEILKNEINNIKRNYQLDKETKRKLIEKNKEEIKKAKIVKKENAKALSDLKKSSILLIHQGYFPLIKAEKEKEKKRNEEGKSKYLTALKKYKDERDSSLIALRKEFESNSLPKEGKERKVEKKNRKLRLEEIGSIYRQKCNDANIAYRDEKDEGKEAIHALYLSKYAAIEKANNKKLPLLFLLEQIIEEKQYSFNLKSFFLKNGLYLTILVLMIAATIYYAALGNGFLFNGDNILLILNQVSPKIFLALGVAGLIVLAGTDLSIGRLVGMSAVFTGMLVTTSGETSVTFFGTSPSFASIPLGLRVVLAFLLSIVACSAISGLAGFFTAKFKMHPFISTLATQLFTFGIMAGVTGNSFTGAPDKEVTAIVSGKGLGDGDFPIMIIWAALGVLVMWFIWNKTKFGKNMFAVGGNPEAASVSGINVFKVTMLVFILAGIYYGIGGSIYGIYTGNVRAQTGQGMEADAIAACVVGGVSFSGGVGKISGVVIGAIIFQAIVVVLPMIGITDANYQLAIKGIIILAAVTLDCVKYIKKK